MGKYWSRRPAHVPAVFLRENFYSVYWCLLCTCYRIHLFYREIGSQHIKNNTVNSFLGGASSGFKSVEVQTDEGVNHGSAEQNRGFGAECATAGQSLTSCLEYSGYLSFAVR